MVRVNFANVNAVIFTVTFQTHFFLGAPFFLSGVPFHHYAHIFVQGCMYPGPA